MAANLAHDLTVRDVPFLTQHGGKSLAKCIGCPTHSSCCGRKWCECRMAPLPAPVARTVFSFPAHVFCIQMVERPVNLVERRG